MLTKTKFAAGLAALAIGVTAFATTSKAQSPYYYWNWGWGAPVGYAPVGYAPVGYGYVVQTRRPTRVPQARRIHRLGILRR
jgi:type IV secretory pathway protease TraF